MSGWASSAGPVALGEPGLAPADSAARGCGAGAALGAASSQPPPKVTLRARALGTGSRDAARRAPRPRGRSGSSILPGRGAVRGALRWGQPCVSPRRARAAVLALRQQCQAVYFFFYLGFFFFPLTLQQVRSPGLRGGSCPRSGHSTRPRPEGKVPVRDQLLVGGSGNPGGASPWAELSVSARPAPAFRRRFSRAGESAEGRRRRWSPRAGTEGSRASRRLFARRFSKIRCFIS